MRMVYQAISQPPKVVGVTYPGIILNAVVSLPLGILSPVFPLATFVVLHAWAWGKCFQAPYVAHAYLARLLSMRYQLAKKVMYVP